MYILPEQECKVHSIPATGTECTLRWDVVSRGFVVLFLHITFKLRGTPWTWLSTL